MNRIIAWFATNHVAANLLMLLLLIGGLFAIPNLKQELIPDVELDTVSVAIAYPGATPAEVEEAICVRVEEALQGLQGIKRLRSTAVEGMGSVLVELVAGEDLRMRLDDIRARIDTIDTFPEEAEEPQVSEVRLRRSVLNVAISGPADERTLKSLGQQVRDEIAALPGITDVDLYAARPYEIAIEVSDAALRRFDLSFDDVLRAVRESSMDLPGGSVKTASGEILLRTKGQAYRGADFERIPLVSRRDGTRLSVGDVASVIDGFEETDQRSRFDGEPTVLVQVYRVGEQKELDISRQVQSYIDEAQARMPEGISVTLWNDSSTVLKSRLDTMLRNGRGGFILVALILASFLRLRLALWVSLGIPTAFLGALAMFPALGMSINFISLMAFIVVLGIVVDDAIVVGENTYTEQTRLGSKLKGAIRGAQGIAIPVCFGVLTTIAAFAPMLFLPGPQGRLTRVVPIVVIACLLFSLVEAMLILPAHLGAGNPARDGEVDRPGGNRLSAAWQGFQAWVARGLTSLIDHFYLPSLKNALEWRYLTVAIAVSLLLVTLGLLGSGLLRFVFQSPVEADVIIVDVALPRGTPVTTTIGVVEQIESIVLELQQTLDAERPASSPSVFSHRLAAIGEQPFRARASAGPVGNRSSPSVGGHLGEIQINLVGTRHRDQSATELTQMLREKVGELPGIEELLFTSTMVATAPPIEVRLSGPRLDELQLASEAVKQRLADYPGVYDIADSFRQGKQELELQIKPAGEALGVSLGDLARQVRQGFYGAEAQSIQRGRDDVKVMVRYPAAERHSLADVEGMRIRTPDGSEVPFTTVADVRLGRGFSTIDRTDRKRVVNVTAEVDPVAANANEIVADLKRGPMEEVLAAFPEVHYSFEGDQAEQWEFLQALGKGQLVALLVIYGLLAVPLGSYLQPLIIMSAIPFGLVGAAFGHVLLRYDFNMYSVVGLVALSGIVVNASLVLVDAIEKRRAGGRDVLLALLEASRARFRPILLTSITTFAGLTPLMLETSMQARFMIPMAISISFGVLFAGFITLYLVPSSYMVLEDLGRLMRRETGHGRIAPQSHGSRHVPLGPKRSSPDRVRKTA